MANLRVRTAVLALGQFVHTGLAVVLTIVLARLLEKESLGTFQKVLLVYGVMAGVLGSHIAESLLYFLPRATESQKSTWLGQTLQLSILVGVGIGLVLYGTAGLWAAQFKNPALEPLLQIFAFFPLADRIIRVVPAALIAEDQADRAALMTVVLGATRLASAIIPCAMGRPLADVFRIMIVCWFLLAAVGLIVLVRQVGFTLVLPRPDRIKEQVLYILPLMAGAIVGVTHHHLGQLVVASVLTEEDYAEYSLGAVQLPLVGIWIMSIASALLPDLVRLGEQGLHTRMLALWRRGVRKGAILVLPAAAVALVIPDYLVVLLYGADYARSMIPFVIYLLVLPVRVTVYAVMFRALGRNRGVLIGAFVGLSVNLLTTLTLVYAGRETELVFAGPAIGYAAGVYANVVAQLMLLSRLLRVPVRDLLPLRQLRSLALLAVASAGIAALARLLPISAGLERWSVSPDGSAAAAVHSLVVVGAFGLVFLTLGWLTRTFDDGERAILRRLLRLEPE